MRLPSTLTAPALVSALMTLAPLLTSSFITYQVLVNEPIISAFTATQWGLLTALCALTSALALTPPTFLALVFGYFLGWWALLPLFVLNMVAILLVYLGVQTFDGARLRPYLEQNPKVRQVLARIQERELWFIFYAKLSPVLPFAVTNLVFALSGARLRNVLLGGFMGMVPRTIVAIWAGTQAHALQSLLANPNAGGLTQWVIVGLVVVSLVGLVRILRK